MSTDVPAEASLAPVGLGVDVGGTKIVGVVIDGAGRTLNRLRMPTPHTTVSDLDDAVVDMVQALRAEAGDPSLPVGLGPAGLMDSSGDEVVFAAHLVWQQSLVRPRLSERLGTALVMDNDATGAAWGEYRFGAGRGSDPMLLVAVGTGLGGGLVIGGQLMRGATGSAGEVGHVLVRKNGRRCDCGQRGCVEQYASGPALARHARREARKHPKRAALLLALVDGDRSRITGPVVTRAAIEGDPAARAAFRRLALELGRGMAGVVAVVDPEIVVLGGGVCEAGDLLLRPTREALEANLTGAGARHMPRMVLAELGSDAAAIGMADLAAQGPYAVAEHAETIVRLGDTSPLTG